MKRTLFLLCLALLPFTACGAPAPAQPAATNTPLPTEPPLTVTQPPPTPQDQSDQEA